MNEAELPIQLRDRSRTSRFRGDVYAGPTLEDALSLEQRVSPPVRMGSD